MKYFLSWSDKADAWKVSQTGFAVNSPVRKVEVRKGGYPERGKGLCTLPPMGRTKGGGGSSGSHLDNYRQYGRPAETKAPVRVADLVITRL